MNGELGLGHCNEVPSPQEVTSLKDQVVTNIACIDGHVAALVAKKVEKCQENKIQRRCTVM